MRNKEKKKPVLRQSETGNDRNCQQRNGTRKLCKYAD